MRTLLSTIKSRWRKAQCPRTYWTGSPASRRSTMDRKNFPARTGTASSSTAGQAPPDESSTNQRAARSSPRRWTASLYRSRHWTTGPLSGSGPCLSASARSGQLARPLIGQQGVDYVVELAHEHFVELVQREADPVVGDPVFLVVVGPDLL